LGSNIKQKDLTGNTYGKEFLHLLLTHLHRRNPTSSINLRTRRDTLSYYQTRVRGEYVHVVSHEYIRQIYVQCIILLYFVRIVCETSWWAGANTTGKTDERVKRTLRSPHVKHSDVLNKERFWATISAGSMRVPAKIKTHTSKASGGPRRSLYTYTPV